MSEAILHSGSLSLVDAPYMSGGTSPRTQLLQSPYKTAQKVCSKYVRIFVIRAICARLVNIGHKRNAKRIIEFLNYTEEDLDLGDPLKVFSVLNFLLFVQDNKLQIMPTLALNEDGYISADWDISEKKSMSITFFDNDELQFMCLNYEDKIKLDQVIKLNEVNSILKQAKLI